MATYRGFHTLRDPLLSLIGQHHSFSDFEVVLVDNSPPHKGMEFGRAASLMRLNFPLKYVHIPNPGDVYMACKARNEGLKACIGDLVFFMHDRTFLHGMDYLKRLWVASKQGVRGVGTMKIVKSLGANVKYGLAQDVRTTGWFAHQDAAPLKYLRMVDGFDESFDGDHGYDDLDLYMRMSALGCEFVMEPSLVSTKIRPYDSIYDGASGFRNQKKYMDRWHALPPYLT